MQTINQHPLPSSFEYQPLQTEMGDYRNDNSQEHINGSINENTIHYSQLKGIIDEEIENCALLNSKKQNESLVTLHSLRISRSVSGKKDNEKLLLKLLNRSDSFKEDEMQTPPKKQSNKVVLGSLFDYSTTNNKNVMVSELDIEITSNKKFQAINDNEERYQCSSRFNTESTGNRKNLLKFFNSKTNKMYPPNEINTQQPKQQQQQQGNVVNIQTGVYKPQITEVSKTPYVDKKFKVPYNMNRNHKTFINTKSDVSKCNGRKANTKESSLTKKINNKTNINDMIQRIKVKYVPSSSKNKNSGTVSYLSTAYQDTTISNTNKHSSFKHNPVSTERIESKPNEVPSISSFRYNDTKMTQRQASIKQKKTSIKELEQLVSKAVKGRDSNNNNNNCHRIINKTIRVSTISNSRSKSKQKSKNKDKIGFNLNCPIFNSIQSIDNQRAQNKLLTTISNKKNATKTYFPNQKSLYGKQKKIEPKQSSIQLHNKKQAISNNSGYLNTECNKVIGPYYPNSNKGLITMNTNPHIQSYTNSIRQVIITPMTTLRMKLLNTTLNSKNNSKATAIHSNAKLKLA